MGSTVIAITEAAVAPANDQEKTESKHEYARRIIHSIKVGIALVLVSLLYLVDPLYDEVGESAMWAIMTVVVVFELYAGATLSKGLNRGAGTILGGFIGCLSAIVAQHVGSLGLPIVIGSSVFIFGALGTYSRFVPTIKQRYDYAALIFILTFSLVVVSGLRAEKVIEVARQRLCTIVMGFIVCICISFLVFPIWASDDLHESLTSQFNNLSLIVEASVEEYFNIRTDKEKKSKCDFSLCKKVLHSKSKDESLANFAKWEPWHGKFGFSYPWKKYLMIGEVLQDVAVTTLSFKTCLQSATQSSETSREIIKEACEIVGSSLAWILRELGQSIAMMKRCQTTMSSITSKLKSMRQDLSLMLVSSSSLLSSEENLDGVNTCSFVFILMELVERMEELVKQVDELGELASFPANK